MNKILITFLDIEGALSSSIFLNKFPDYELRITSVYNFIKKLKELLTIKNSSIVILGSGPGKKIQEAQNLIEEICEKNEVYYLLHFNDPDYTNILKKINNIKLYIKTDISLSELTSTTFNIDNAHTNYLLKNKEHISSVIDEAKFRFFNFDNREFYPQKIKELSYKKLSFFKKINRDYEYYNQKFLFGKNPKISILKKEIEKIGEDSLCNILISGESGTGKTTLAYAMHYISNREGNFEVISCANFQENLLESKLFGYKKGSFTGASKDTYGLFDKAHKGTLFLDEIGEMPLHLQSKLLRVLQDGKFKRVGGNEEITVDVRIIAATNKNLKKSIQKKEFRADLYYRIANIEINSIPLREQISDINYISNFLLEEIASKRNKKTPTLSSNNIEQLSNYNWPGNVRELQNVLLKAFITDNWDFSYLNNTKTIKKFSKETLYKEKLVSLKKMQEDYIKFAFEKCDNNISETAREIDVSINTVKKYLKKASK